MAIVDMTSEDVSLFLMFLLEVLIIANIYIYIYIYIFLITIIFLLVISNEKNH